MTIDDIIFLKHKFNPERFRAKKIIDQHKVLTYDVIKNLHVQLPINEFDKLTEDQVLKAIWSS
jgi:hypothetical protein